LLVNLLPPLSFFESAPQLIAFIKTRTGDYTHINTLLCSIILVGIITTLILRYIQRGGKNISFKEKETSTNQIQKRVPGQEEGAELMLAFDEDVELDVFSDQDTI